MKTSQNNVGLFIDLSMLCDEKGIPFELAPDVKIPKFSFAI